MSKKANLPLTQSIQISSSLEDFCIVLKNAIHINKICHRHSTDWIEYCFVCQMFLPTVYHLITIPLISFMISYYFCTDFSVSDRAYIPRPILHNCLQSTKFESSLPIKVQLTPSLGMIIDRRRDSSAVLIEIYLLSLTYNYFWSSRVDWHYCND